MRGIKLLVDSTPLLTRGAGIKSYLYYWLRALEESAGPHQVSRFPWIRAVGSFGIEHSLTGKWTTKANLLLLHLGVNKIGPPFADFLGRQADVFHISSHTRYAPRRPRLTATIYDLTCWLMPEVHERSNVDATKAFGEYFWRRADALIAISHSAKNDAVQTLGLPAEKIHVIYPGVAPQFFDVPSGEVARTGAKYSLERPYALFVGTIEPRKNLPVLLNAWEKLPASYRKEVELLIAGPFGWESACLRARLESPPPGVRYLGHLPEDDLPGLTAGAQMFIYPSLYEGFGLPVAQAMAAGVPVLTSNNSSMIEISERCGLHFDPRSENEIVSGLRRLVDDSERRSAFGRQGRSQAEQFRWPVNATKSWELFEILTGRVNGQASALFS